MKKRSNSPFSTVSAQTKRKANIKVYSQISRQSSGNMNFKHGDDSSDQFQDALSDLPQNIFNYYQPLEELKVPLMNLQNKELKNKSNKKKERSQSSNMFYNNKAISSIHSIHDDFRYGQEIHYLMDVPSPRFSSVMGDDIGEDEEKNEIIRCIINNDNQALQEILQLTQLDVTQIKDEMGYSLIHLAAYNNSDRSMDILFIHILNQKDTNQMINRREKLKEWINQPTNIQEMSSSQQNNTPQTLEGLDNCGGFTALHFASYHGNPRMIELLVENGGNVYSTNRQEINMLHVAAQGDSPYSIAYFRKMGISINSRDRELSTPLHWACISQAQTVVLFLLAWGADINAKDSAGYTPLHLAVKETE